MEWISVNVNLPKMHDEKNDEYDVKGSEPVLVFCTSGRMVVAEYRTFDGVNYWCGDDILSRNENVTHWMPLPEPPKR